jgi:hypothetical protein
LTTVSETVGADEVPANSLVRDSRATAVVCRGTRRDGEPCRSTLVLADGFCRVHSPATTDLVEQTRSAGIASGEARREQVKTVRDRLREKVEDNVEMVWAAFESGMTSDDERAQIAAATAVLAEAYGRPAVSIIGDPNQPVSFVLESLLARAREEQ